MRDYDLSLIRYNEKDSDYFLRIKKIFEYRDMMCALLQLQDQRLRELVAKDVIESVQQTLAKSYY